MTSQLLVKPFVAKKCLIVKVAYGDKLRVWVAEALSVIDSPKKQEIFCQDAGVSKPTLNKALSSNDSVTIGSIAGIAMATGHNVQEAFGVKVPLIFKSPEHQALHENLQGILESDEDLQLCIKVSLDALYKEAVERKAKMGRAGARKKAPTEGQSHKRYA